MRCSKPLSCTVFILHPKDLTSTPEKIVSSGSLPQGTILTAHLWHIPWISAKTVRWEQKDSEGWGLPKVTGNPGRDETWRSRMRSYWGLPCLYLDLVLRLRTPAAECLDPESIWLQVWFLLGAFGRIKVRTAGKSGLVLGFHRFRRFFPFYWWHRRGPREPTGTELEQRKASACHLFQLRRLQPDLFRSIWYWSPAKQGGDEDCSI